MAKVQLTQKKSTSYPPQASPAQSQPAIPATLQSNTMPQVAAPARAQQANKVPFSAATAPSGITGVLPLPVGKVVSSLNPERLLPEERAQLRLIGWKEGQPIPENMASIIAEVVKETQEDFSASLNELPVDPSTPPVKFKPIDVATLPPAQQAVIKEKIALALD